MVWVPNLTGNGEPTPIVLPGQFMVPQRSSRVSHLAEGGCGGRPIVDSMADLKGLLGEDVGPLVIPFSAQDRAQVGQTPGLVPQITSTLGYGQGLLQKPLGFWCVPRRWGVAARSLR
jgi:hypothetical protein